MKWGQYVLRNSLVLIAVTIGGGGARDGLQVGMWAESAMGRLIGWAVWAVGASRKRVGPTAQSARAEVGSIDL